MKLWQKEYSLDKKIETFTVGKDRELDIYLAEFDVLGSLAHTQMLQTINLLTSDELTQLRTELLSIYQIIKDGNFVIEEGVEDVHSQVELLLTRKLGETGKKIHSGRSRNDQVLVDLKLFMRDRITKVVQETRQLFDLLIELSNTHKHVLLPGYTHLQIAMPSSFGLWFGAYAESLIDDMLLMQAAYKITNKNPLGSGAGYGSSFPLNRTLTTQLLGFEAMHYNVVYAQMSRGKTEQTVCTAIAAIAGTLSKMAMDICLYNCQNFGFLTLPDQLTTGSSIMPHKKNPDVAELLRGRTNRLKSLPNELNLMLTNLPSGYHRELQLTKEVIMPAFEEIVSCLEITRFMLAHIEVKANILNDEKYKYLFSVERVNELVLQGIPFREAYQQVGKEIASDNYYPSMQLHHTHEGSIGNLNNEQISSQMKQVLKGFNFVNVEKALSDLINTTSSNIHIE
jgi:argininosuccinate lyase